MSTVSPPKEQKNNAKHSWENWLRAMGMELFFFFLTYLFYLLTWLQHSGSLVVACGI